MNDAQAMEFWFGRVNYEQRQADPSDLKLDRMRALLALLGNPQDRLRIVHIAGSKGKGSTSAMLAAILRQAGYRTGLFTSPHLVEVEERIQVDDEPITRAELGRLLEEIRDACARHPGWPTPQGIVPLAEALTFFEIGTALGFLHFVRRRVDVAVVEVGLGGRFDSTNVCQPLLAIITSISFDHTQQLGNTLASIAMEKAGIIKPGRPVLSGARDPEAQRVIARISRERSASLRQLGVDFSVAHEPARIEPALERLPRVEVVSERRRWPTFELGLIGAHQADNAALAVAAVEQLRDQGLAIDDRAVRAGLAGLRWPARLEVIGRQPLVVLDCAHNLASIHALLETLHESFPPRGRGRRRLIFASSRDKDVAGMLQLLAPHFDHFYLTRFAAHSRALPPEQLASLLPHEARAACTLWRTSGDAWHEASAAAGADDLLCITGSVYLAGELRPLALANSRTPCMLVPCA